MVETVKTLHGNPSYFALREAGKAWAIDLVTPVEGSSPIRTELGRYLSRNVAIAHGSNSSERTGLPFKHKREIVRG
jgi:hypothetical protein